MLNRLRLRFLKALGFDWAKGHTFFARALSPGALVVDLGANQGDFSTYLASRYGACCCLVEPNPELFALLPVLPGGRNFHLAIAAADQPVTFFPAAWSEEGSLYESGAGAAAVTVPGARFTTFLTSNAITHGALLKMDIEGAERTLFTDTADATLARFDQITIEFHDFLPALHMERETDAIIRRLEALGFHFMRTANANMDALFLHERVRSPALARLYSGLLKLHRRRTHPGRA